MNVNERIFLMGRGLIALGIWTAGASLWAVLANIGAALDGESWGISRLLIGLIGLAGASLLFAGHSEGKTGWQLIVAWAVLQVPFYASSPDHNVTKQLIDILLGASSQTTINGELTSFSAVGINLVGGILLIWAMALRGRLDLWRRRAEPAVTA